MPENYQQLRAGVQIRSGNAAVNVGQVIDVAQQPVQFSYVDCVKPSMVVALRFVDESTAITAAIDAIATPNEENALRVTHQGAPLDHFAPDAVSVGVASTAVLSATPERRYLALINTSVATISLGLGNPAVLNSGITLSPGGSYEMSEAAGNLFTGAINAIASVAASNLAVQEAE